MTLVLRQTGASSCANPVLQFAAIDGDGFLQDVHALRFQVWSLDTGAVVAPTPGDANDYTTVVLTDCPGGDRLSKGRYVARYTAASSQNPGEYEVRWFVTRVSGGAEEEYRTSFLIVEDNETLTDEYVSIYEMRCEGVPETINEAKIRSAIRIACRRVEALTRLFFEPRYLTFEVDGRGGPILQLGVPIIGIENVEFTVSTFSPADLPIATGDLIVYNRHIRQGLLHPDDRFDPKLEFLRTPNSRPFGYATGDEVDFISGYAGFTESQLNVRIVGLFGFTEPDRSPTGSTPALLKHAVKRLAMRHLRPMWQDAPKSFGETTIGPVASERTKDQSITYAQVRTSSLAAPLTGDVEVDEILSHFIAPAIHGSV